MSRQQSRESDPQGGRPRGRQGRRVLAEWVSLGASALLIAGIAGYLLYEGLRGDSAFIFPEVRVLAAQSQRHGEAWVVAVEVRNTGRRTLRDLEVRIRYATPDGEEEDTLGVDYLGEGSSQTLYFQVRAEPERSGLRAQALHYRLE